MNSKCRTILGTIMLIIVVSISAYYIVSGFSEIGRTDEEDAVLTNAVQKNYLSPISVDSFPIDKTEALASSVILLDRELNARRSVNAMFSMQNVTSRVNALGASLTERIRSVGMLMYPVVKAHLMEQAGYAALDKYLLTSENHETYMQNKYQQELDDTVHHLFDNLFITNDSAINDYLNIREAPGGDVTGRMYPETGGTLLDIQEGWAQVSSGGIVGWVSAEYILTGTEMLQDSSQLTVVVDEENLVFRREADTHSESIDILQKDTEVQLLSYSAGWVCVSYKDQQGYLKAEYVHLKAGKNTAVAMSAELWNETLEAAGLIEQPVEEVPVEKETLAVEAAVTEAPAEPVAAEPSANDLARQRIDAIYAEGRSSMGPIYLSADEIYLLSCVIMMEAGAECYDGKLAVAGVVLNRLRNGYWGSTLNEVIYYPGQFSGAGTGLLESILASGPNEESVRAAYEACAGIHNIGGYMYFCSLQKAQYDQYSAYLIIDKQCFYLK